jgi:pimeloyl-ACP methyl ester carboxylesterase
LSPATSTSWSPSSSHDSEPRRAAGQDGAVPIHHETSGSGPVVLLTHGFGASSHMFAKTVADLAADHTAVVWDQLGHGRSDSPSDPAAYSVAASLDAMLAILDAVGADRAVLLGHSLGGYLSLELAIAHPERTAGLVLVDTGPGYRSDRGRAEWNAMAERYARDLDERGLDGLPGSDELAAGVHRSAAGLARSARGVLKQADGHVIDALPTVAVPTLVVVGERDDAFLAGSRYMADKIPGATLAVIDGAGHAPPVSHPDAFNDTLRAFLAGLGDRA